MHDSQSQEGCLPAIVAPRTQPPIPRNPWSVPEPILASGLQPDRFIDASKVAQPLIAFLIMAQPPPSKRANRGQHLHGTPQNEGANHRVSADTSVGCIDEQRWYQCRGRITDDGELLRAWRKGDARAGRYLFERYFEAVSRFFGNKVTSLEDRDELIQETFMACVDARDRIKDPSRFRAYLFQIARNTLSHHLRNRYRIHKDHLSSRSMQDIAPGVSTMVRERDQKRQLLVALRELPIDIQTAIELKFWEDMSSAEIALVLKIPASTVRSHLRRGRILLERRLLAEECETDP